MTLYTQGFSGGSSQPLQPTPISDTVARPPVNNDPGTPVPVPKAPGFQRPINTMPAPTPIPTYQPRPISTMPVPGQPPQAPPYQWRGPVNYGRFISNQRRRFPVVPSGTNVTKIGNRPSGPSIMPAPMPTPVPQPAPSKYPGMKLPTPMPTPDYALQGPTSMSSPQRNYLTGDRAAALRAFLGR